METRGHRVEPPLQHLDGGVGATGEEAARYLATSRHDSELVGFGAAGGLDNRRLLSATSSGSGRGDGGLGGKGLLLGDAQDTEDLLGLSLVGV